MGWSKKGSSWRFQAGSSNPPAFLDIKHTLQGKRMSENEAKAIIEPAATRIRDPLSGRSIWMANLISKVSLEENQLFVELTFKAEHTEQVQSKIKSSLEQQIQNIGWAGTLSIESKTSSPEKKRKSLYSKPSQAKAPTKPKDPVQGMSGPGMGAHGGPIQKLPIPGIKKIIAVASGKGGVGKSTVACNLAIALKLEGLNVGMMDADVYGPSLPTMLRIQGTPIANANQQIIPLSAYGISCMSMGFMVKDDEPIIWRGPMVMGVIRQFFQNVAWGELDVLVVDLPPGTGDAQLTMIQAVSIDGAVIVTTPQHVAVLDAVRGIEMFRKLEAPILGLVENMAFFELPDGSVAHPFGQGGGRYTAERYAIPFLGEIPLEDGIRLGGDIGVPVALSSDPISEPFLKIGQQIKEKLFPEEDNENKEEQNSEQ
ncbi:MAG: hypothetical protein CMK59_13560 [Proteobacteria bacterium]|nr:hypothetical protein [Pseudomonadota bacterium]